jgi:glutamate formiminotransferase/formiminotetrahydrofolate cyclodeaminase
MRRLVECIPNFSEGRRQEVIDRIVAALTSVEGVRLLDVQADADHNRAVVTVVGSPEAVEEAAFRGARAAAELIDMNRHSGEHPRMGATDVIPLVPISGVSMQGCVDMARRLGERIGTELRIPVYLYAEAALREDRHSLPAVRKGEYEAIKAEIAALPERAPDFGPREVGSAGATAVGARYPLIAFNVNLGTGDVSVAEAIARAVRHSNGGLRYVQARGFELAERGLAQVSMNLTRYDQTPIQRAFNLVCGEARRYGVAVVGSEIVGMVPQDALIDVSEWYLRLENFRRDQVLENRLAVQEESASEQLPLAFLDALASESPTPGGGSVSALAGALAAAMAHMVTVLTIGRDKYAAVEETMREVKLRSRSLKDELVGLISQDSQAFEEVMQAYRLPRGTSEENARRAEAIEAALIRATEVPLATARCAMQVLELTRTVAEHGNVRAISDAGVAGHLALAAVEGAALNVDINVGGIRDIGRGDSFRQESADLLTRARSGAQDVQRVVQARIARG